MHSYASVRAAFAQHFRGQPRLFASPGRINLLGEHTDYNAGFVLPAAIDKEVTFALGANGRDDYCFVSLDMQAEHRTSAVAPSDVPWANYLLGVIAQILQSGRRVPGFNLVFGGDVPIGAGVSSSAAIECGLLFALNAVFQLGLSRAQMAQMAQLAEHEYAGVKCGIMDQFAVLHGQADHVIKLDCRSLEYSLHALDLDGHKLVLCDTQVKHSLASSAYNRRREACEEAVAALALHYPVSALRDASLVQLHTVAHLISSEALQRATYIINENQRVALAMAALEHNDLNALGELMFATHRGLRDEYAVSCPELDQLVDTVHGLPGVLGARMMGGGFGGCTINLVRDDALTTMHEAVTKAYYAPRGLSPAIIINQLNDGTREIH